MYTLSLLGYLYIKFFFKPANLELKFESRYIGITLFVYLFTSGLSALMLHIYGDVYFLSYRLLFKTTFTIHFSQTFYAIISVHGFYEKTHTKHKQISMLVK